MCVYVKRHSVERGESLRERREKRERRRGANAPLQPPNKERQGEIRGDGRDCYLSNRVALVVELNLNLNFELKLSG